MKYVCLAILTALSFPLSLAAATATPTLSPPGVDDNSDRNDLTALKTKAERGNAIAQYHLGLAYAEGRQTPKDPMQAFAWLTLAAERGIGGKAINTLLESLSPWQLAQGKLRLDSLRAAHPALRAPASAATPGAPVATSGAAPVIDAPSPSSTVTPIITIPAPPGPAGRDNKELQDQLAAAGAENRQLSTEVSAARKEIEQLRKQLAARGTGQQQELAAVQSAGRETQARLTQQATELTASRAEAAAAQLETVRLQTQLTAARDALTARNAAATDAGNAEAALQQERTAHAATHSTLDRLKAQMEELSAGRTALGRELASREATAEAARANAAEEAKKLMAQNTALSAKAETLSRELAQARGELGTSSTALAQKTSSLQNELNETKSRLAAAEKAGVARSEELAKLKAAAASSARNAGAAAELEAARQETSKAEQKLTSANQELATLRPRAAAVRELETRVQQLETEKAAFASARPVDPGVSKEELARATAAHADASAKLETALRSYTLLQEERNDLKARLAELSKRHAAANEVLAATDPRARPASTSPTSASVPVAGAASAELESLRIRAATAERAAEASRAELERANQLLAGYRPVPTRPTQPPGQPARTHTVVVGETLSGLAQRYYGTPARWPEIVAANRDVLPDERSFVAGKTLRIP